MNDASGNEHDNEKGGELFHSDDEMDVMAGNERQNRPVTNTNFLVAREMKHPFAHVESIISPRAQVPRRADIACETNRSILSSVSSDRFFLPNEAFRESAPKPLRS